MNRLLLLLITTVCTIDDVQAQIPSWAWAKSGINSSSANAKDVAIDGQGNVYSAGIFSGTLDLGNNILTGIGS